MKGIIYKTTCLINNKVYIGQHSGIDENYFGSGNLIIKAIKKYGKENFIRETLRECSTQKELDAFEYVFIKRFDSCNPEIGYNILPGTANRFGSVNPATLLLKGRKMPEEQKAKMRVSAIGKYAGIQNPMYGVHRFNEQAPMFNKKHSDETKQKMSISGIGKHYALKGRKYSDEHKKKISEAAIKRWGVTK